MAVSVSLAVTNCQALSVSVAVAPRRLMEIASFLCCCCCCWTLFVTVSVASVVALQLVEAEVFRLVQDRCVAVPLNTPLYTSTSPSPHPPTRALNVCLPEVCQRAGRGSVAAKTCPGGTSRINGKRGRRDREAEEAGDDGKLLR